MASKQSRRRKSRTRSIESLEIRQVMSADPLAQLLGGSIQHHAFADETGEAPALVHHHQRDADFWIDHWSERDLGTMLGDVEQTLSSAHGATGLTNVRNDYGFIGTGQTVAVIDSGIAWDHYALGGGFGSNYRVVGGWDFTEENDANPYDDGPWGSHGTHVAGIVGADAAGTSNDGVAPGVDLVGLRVFNDAGDGYFHWVENALQWVHQNRNAFENPITAVNLSLGTSWNSTSIPSWAMLEDEFAQLEADGIFITVSAGNSFASYNTTGLSYPAASPYVVPVMSVTDAGNLSSFSQRHPSAIGAPGQYIVSTVPDYIGNQNSVNDDWASFSGTSMAAPYVAGASVIVREAMQFVEYASITQDVIFNHMMSTATTFYDAATGLNYKRLNLNAAIDALMPSDDYGSTAAAAHNLGALSGTSEIAGLIGKLNDADYFRFTAAATGTVTFNADATHGLAPVWYGANGTVSGARGETFTLDVVAGQFYTLGLSSSSGIGYYNLSIEAQSAFTYTDWGTITQSRVNNLSNAGEKWYCLRASQAGYLSAEAFYATSGGNLQLALYDSNLQLVASGAANASGGRVDLLVDAGTDYFLRVTGTNANVDFRLTNLVSQNGSTVNVTGTSAADVFAFHAGSTHEISVNGVTYSFDANAVNSFNIDGHSGYDSITMTGTSGNETATLRVGDATLAGHGFTANARGIENVVVHAGGGYDRANLYDSNSDDRFTATPTLARLNAVNGSYAHEAHGFDRNYAYSSGGYDRAFLYDGATDDNLRATPQFAVLRGNQDEFFNYAAGFDRVDAHASGGYDRAKLEDGATDDYLRATPQFAVLRGNQHEFFNYAAGFDRVDAYASGGYDRAKLEDGITDDYFRATPEFAVLRGKQDEFFNYAAGFDRVDAYASGGYDRAKLEDGATDDNLRATPEFAVLRGKHDVFFNYAAGFDRVDAYASGGYDRAKLEDGATNDYFRATPEFAVLRGQQNEFFNYAAGFDRVDAYASGGYDRAKLEDGGTDDYFRATPEFAVLRGQQDEFLNYAAGFDRVDALASGGGYDVAKYNDSAGDDLCTIRPDRTMMQGDSYTNIARGFRWAAAFSTAGGYDRVVLYDSPGDDALLAAAWGVRITGGDFGYESRGFDDVVAELISGGNNTVDSQAVDYVFDLAGQWS